MRALRYDRYGPLDVLRVEELLEPSPGVGRAKIRVRAVGLNPVDWKIVAGHLRFLPLFRRPPRGVGLDYAGEIVGVGGGATQRYFGERVFGSLMPFGRDGACADFVVAPYNRIVSLPPEVDYVQAAALPIAGGTALQALADEAHVTSGQRVLITGAAGGVGHFAVQIAKHLGAHVVAICSARNADFVRSLGANEVVDYAKGRDNVVINTDYDAMGSYVAAADCVVLFYEDVFQSAVAAQAIHAGLPCIFSDARGFAVYHGAGLVARDSRELGEAMREIRKPATYRTLLAHVRFLRRMLSPERNAERYLSGVDLSEGSAPQSSEGSAPRPAR